MSIILLSLVESAFLRVFMTTLRRLNEFEFESWLFSFIDLELGTEADMIFIYLFQEGSMFSNANTLSERILVYLSEKPQKRKYLKQMIGSLLDFLVEKGALDKESSREEKRKIAAIFQGNCQITNFGLSE